VNKMNMRNVGIVFSPTLGIPAGVFSLMLGEFNRVFNVDNEPTEDSPTDGDGEDGSSERDSDASRRNSRQYSNAAADQLLGLGGRSLKAAPEETPSDGDDYSVLDESGTETTGDDFTIESSLELAAEPSLDNPRTGQASAHQQPSHNHQQSRTTPPDTPVAHRSSKAAHAAATKGLNVRLAESNRGNRHSRIIPGLPVSPRPPPSPSPSPSSRTPEKPPSPNT